MSVTNLINQHSNKASVREWLSQHHYCRWQHLARNKTWMNNQLSWSIKHTHEATIARGKLWIKQLAILLWPGDFPPAFTAFTCHRLVLCITKVDCCYSKIEWLSCSMTKFCYWFWEKHVKWETFLRKGPSSYELIIPVWATFIISIVNQCLFF